MASYGPNLALNIEKYYIIKTVFIKVNDIRTVYSLILYISLIIMSMVIIIFSDGWIWFIKSWNI